MKPLSFLFLFSSLIISPLPAQMQGVSWLEDEQAAKAAAAEQKKDILINFTGSGWCHWCTKLEEEVFAHAPFQEWASEKFILLKVDTPKEPSEQSDTLREQNDSLKEKYQPAGFPTIVLTDAKGRPYAQTGYQPDGPHAYVQHLEELQKQKTELWNKFKNPVKIEEGQEVDDVEKAKALIAVLEELSPAHRHFYTEQIARIKSLDPDDKTGFRKKEEDRLARTALETKLNKMLQIGEHKEAVSSIDSFIAARKLAKTDQQELLAMQVNIHMSKANFDQAEKVLNKIIKIDNASELGSSAKIFKPRLTEMKKEHLAQEQKPAE